MGNPYQKAWEVLCEVYDDHDGEIDAETLVDLVKLEMAGEELPEEGWLKEEAGYLCGEVDEEV